jgi:hypothetical protein
VDIFGLHDLACKLTPSMYIPCLGRCWTDRNWKEAIASFVCALGKGEVSVRASGKAGCWRLTCVQIDFLLT